MIPHGTTACNRLRKRQVVCHTIVSEWTWDWQRCPAQGSGPHPAQHRERKVARGNLWTAASNKVSTSHLHITNCPIPLAILWVAGGLAIPTCHVLSRHFLMEVHKDRMSCAYGCRCVCKCKHAATSAHVSEHDTSACVLITA